MIGKLAVIGVIGFSYFAFYMMKLMDISKVLVFKGHENCIRKEIEMPSEDIVIFGDYVIGAVADGPAMYYKHFGASQARPGYLIAIDPRTHSTYPIKTHDFPKDIQMNAHGLTLRDSTLYVISHSYSKGGECILLFNLTVNEEEKKVEAYFIKQHKLGEDYGMYNGIAVVDSNHFYLTQWVPFADTTEGRDNSFLVGMQRMAIMTFTKANGVKLCTVDGEKVSCEYKARGYIPNGILKHDDLLFFADSMRKTVEVYKIEENLDLSFVQTIYISHVVDNLHMHNGNIYITGIGKMLDYLLFSESVKNNEEWHFVPGGFSKIYKEGNEWKSTEVFMQNIISLSSSICITEGQITVVSIIDPAVVFCPYKE